MRITMRTLLVVFALSSATPIAAQQSSINPGGKVALRDPIRHVDAQTGTLDDNGFNSTPQTAKIAGTQSLALPNGAAGNITPLQSSLVLEATVPAALATKSIATEVITLTSNKGYNAPNYGQGGSASANNQIVSYRSMVAQQGSSDVWVDNPLLRHETNDPINTHGIELDYDMVSTNRYSTTDLGHGVKADGTTFEGRTAFGMSITGTSPNGGIATAGMNVSSAQGKLFQYGYTTGFGLNIAAYEDGSDAPNSYLDLGPHAVGINLEKAAYSSGSAVALAYGHSVTGLDSTGVRHVLIRTGGNSTTGATVAIGDATIQNIVAMSSVLPQAITYEVGTPAKRWLRMSASFFNTALFTPTSSSQTCTVGDEAADANYIYICTATNHWRRSALSDF